VTPFFVLFSNGFLTKLEVSCPVPLVLATHSEGTQMLFRMRSRYLGCANCGCSGG
jgi:hypothetical protein